MAWIRVRIATWMYRVAEALEERAGRMHGKGLNAARNRDELRRLARMR